MNYLVHINKIGETLGGESKYEFLFTDDTQTYWGEGGYEITPASICKIKPDPKRITLTKILIIRMKLTLAQNQSCFSMQDCIDGIIPVAWEDIRNYEESPEEGRLIFKYGTNIDDLEYELSIRGLNFE